MRCIYEDPKSESKCRKVYDTMDVFASAGKAEFTLLGYDYAVTDGSSIRKTPHGANPSDDSQYVSGEYEFARALKSMADHGIRYDFATDKLVKENGEEFPFEHELSEEEFNARVDALKGEPEKNDNPEDQNGKDGGEQKPAGAEEKKDDAEENKPVGRIQGIAAYRENMRKNA